MGRNTTGTIQGNQNVTTLINQLKTATKQYPTLTKEEERAMIEKHRDNREELNKLLCMHNIKMVFNIAKKYMTKTNSFDDLVQDGMMGLSEAANRFDIDLNVKFCTYAHSWIRKFILANFYGKQAELEKVSTSLNSPSLCSNSKSSDGNDVTLESYVNEYIDPSYDNKPTIESQLSSNEESALCKNLLKTMNDDTSLSSTDKAVFVDLFCNHEKTRDVAEKYEMTSKDVNLIKSKILLKMKEVLATDFKIFSYDDINALA